MLGREVQEAPEPSAEAGQPDVGVPNPSIGPHAVELTAARQGYEMTMEEQQRDRPLLDPSERPSKHSRLSAPQQNVMRVEMQHQ